MELSMYTLLSIAKAHHASDLHITVGVRPKCRISGTLYEMDGFEKLTPAMTKELVESMFGPKQKATMEATGEVDFAYTDTRVGRFRVNAFHQRGSYAAVLRIVASDIPTPEALGIPEAVLGLTKKKRGLVLVTGPTGSGKSTTLYSLLRDLNKEDKNIITVEDPVEFSMDGINQVNVNTKAGLTFASGLRSILRQDPDIVMLGEIRDTETAEIAVRAAITGHLVLSTIHTNDAPSSIVRLKDMGVAPYLVSSALVGIIAQRLIRKLCIHCKEEYIASDYEKEILGVPKYQDLTLYRKVGCNRCSNTGYKGRVGIYEVMEINREIRDLINADKPLEEITNAALRNNMKTLNKSAMNVVLNGNSTVEELLRVTLLGD